MRSRRIRKQIAVPNADHYGIVIGITDYLYFQRLDAAEGDAREFAKWLCDPNGGDLPSENVRLILSGDSDKWPGGYPWKDHVDDELRDIIKGRKGPIGKRLYFYFSGHGCLPSFGNIALLMANSAADVLGRNIGPGPYVKSLAERAHFDELVFFLDCCRGYEGSADVGSPPFNSQGTPHPAFVNVKSMIAVGSQIGQLSYAPDTPNERSFFTEFLLEGLRGGATDADRSITAESLFDYVQPRVTAKAALFGKRQIPEMPAPADIVFKQGVPNQRLITLTFPPEWNQPVELQDGTFQQLLRSDGQKRTMQAVLSPGLYQIVYPGDPNPGQPTVQMTLRILPAATGANVVLDRQKAEYNV